MPNWCITRFNFRGTNDDVAILYNKICEAYPDCDTKNPSHWSLENILKSVNLENRLSGPNAISCEGYITAIDEFDENTDNEFEIETETPWRPYGKMWDEIIKILGLNITMSFKAEEPGTELYLAYDPHEQNHFEIPRFKKTETLY